MEDEYNSALSQAQALGLVGPPIRFTMSLQEIDIFKFLIPELPLSFPLSLDKNRNVGETQNFAQKPAFVLVNPVPVPIEVKVGA